jgi:hypothetical protein
MRNKLNITYNILACLLIASIVLADLFKAIPNIILALLAILSPFVLQKDKVKKLPSFILFYFAFLIIVSFTLVFQNRLIEDLKYIKGFLLIPVILLVLYNAGSKYISLFKASYIVPLLGLAIYMSARISYMYVTQPDFSFTNGEIVYEYIIGERIYLGFYTAIGAFLAFDLFKTKFYNKWIWLFCAVFLTVFIILIGSRIGLIVWSTWVFFEIVNAVKNHVIKWYYIAVFAIITAVVLLNTEIYDRLTYHNEYNEPFLTGLMEFEPRMEIWPCAIKNTNTSNVVFGQGFSNGQESLISCYSNIEKPEKADWFILRRYNTHNQYLNVLMGSGLLSLALFVIANLMLIWHYRKTKYIGIILGITLFLLIENVVFRQAGYYVIVIILLLASLEKRSKHELDKMY